jgi:hypothetical protein
MSAHPWTSPCFSKTQPAFTEFDLERAVFLWYKEEPRRETLTPFFLQQLQHVKMDTTSDVKAARAAPAAMVPVAQPAEQSNNSNAADNVPAQQPAVPAVPASAPAPRADELMPQSDG